MAEYIDRVEYCKNYCRCSNEYCDKESCPIWKAPAADVEPVKRWIPCSERLPEDLSRCLVCRYDYVTKTRFVDILWFESGIWWDGSHGGDYAVTHWQPLPEPPKEGDVENAAD